MPTELCETNSTHSAAVKSVEVNARMSWQEDLSRWSLKKREKLAALGRLVGLLDGKRCLEIGCDLGVTSAYLRRRGGSWVSADAEEDSLREAVRALGEGVVLFSGNSLPFARGAFDLVLVIDFLEHIDDDSGFLEEAGGLVAPGGELVVTVPRSGMRGGLKRILGLRPEHHGHKREGYSSGQLAALLERSGWQVEEERGFSRCFTEGIETLLNAAYLFVFKRGKTGGGMKGTISPRNEGDVSSRKWPFRIYLAMWPLLWLVSRLDYLLFFTPGHVLGMRAVRRELPGDVR